jgi:Transcriptional regulators
MRKDKIKIADIAKELEISTISVSRALSGQSGVSDELRSKVLEKAEEMGYTKGKNNSDLNILVLHQKPYIHDNTNFSYMVQGIERAIQKTGAEYSVEFVDKEHQDKLYLPYKLAKGNCFDGTIFIGRFQKEYVDFIQQKIKNYLFYTGYSPSYNYDSVWFNFNNGGYKQCQYLINNGHISIGYVGTIKFFKDRERLIGITTALEDYGFSINENFFIDVEEDFGSKILELMKSKERPTALICQWDLTAIKIIKLLYDKGYKVPEDISIIGSGNSEMSAISIPSLTTLDLNIEYSCETAVALLLKRINSTSKPYENITINSTLVERESVKKIK